MQNRIKQLRKEKHVTLQMVADKLGLSNGTIANYENGKREPKLKTWEALAEYFNVPIAYLQGYSDYKELDLVDPNKHKLMNDDGALTKDGLDNIRKSILSEEQRQSNNLSAILKAYLPDINNIAERVDQNIPLIEDRLLISDLINGVSHGLISILMTNVGIGSHRELLQETANQLKEINDRLNKVAFDDTKAYEAKNN